MGFKCTFGIRPYPSKFSPNFYDKTIVLRKLTEKDNFGNG